MGRRRQGFAAPEHLGDEPHAAPKAVTAERRTGIGAEKLPAMRSGQAGPAGGNVETTESARVGVDRINESPDSRIGRRRSGEPKRLTDALKIEARSARRLEITPAGFERRRPYAGVIVAKRIKINEGHGAARDDVMRDARRNDSGVSRRRLVQTPIRRRKREVERRAQRHRHDGDVDPVRREAEGGADIGRTVSANRHTGRRILKAARRRACDGFPMLALIFHDIPLLFAAAGFAAMGVAALAAPTVITRQFDIGELSLAGRNEVRAVYGGFGLSMAASLAVAINDPPLRAGICLAAGMALGGMGLGRIASAAIDRSLGKAPAFYLVLELVCGALLIWAR